MITNESKKLAALAILLRVYGTYSTQLSLPERWARRPLGNRLMRSTTFRTTGAAPAEDETGKPLNGERRYRLHFPAGPLPLACYWRISLDDLDGYFTVNPIKRYGIGNMAEKLEADSDGSLTLYIQHDSPGKDKETNWLPAPKEGFFLMMRMYQPEEAMYRGAYVLPPLQEMK